MPPPILFPLRRLWAGGENQFGGVPPFMQSDPLPAVTFTLRGLTLDSSGVALASCVVTLWRTLDDLLMDRITSDGSGNYSFSVGLGEEYYLRATKAGVPEVDGTTVSNVIAS